MQRAIALPIRVDQSGRLARCDAVDAVVDLLATMAATDQAAWPHAPWFGLQQKFAGIDPSRDGHPALAEAFNFGLAKLGVDWVKVEFVKAEPDPDGLGRRFQLALSLNGEPRIHRALPIE